MRKITHTALAAFYRRDNRSLIVHPRDRSGNTRRLARIAREYQRDNPDLLTDAPSERYAIDPITNVLTRIA